MKGTGSASNLAGQTPLFSVQFIPSVTLNPTDSISVVFPSGFYVPPQVGAVAASFVSNPNSGTPSVSVTGQTVKITLAAGQTASAMTQTSFVIDGVVNPSNTAPGLATSGVFQILPNNGDQFTTVPAYNIQGGQPLLCLCLCSFFLVCVLILLCVGVSVTPSDLHLGQPCGSVAVSFYTNTNINNPGSVTAVFPASFQITSDSGVVTGIASGNFVSSGNNYTITSLPAINGQISLNIPTTACFLPLVLGTTTTFTILAPSAVIRVNPITVTCKPTCCRFEKALFARPFCLFMCVLIHVCRRGHAEYIMGRPSSLTCVRGLHRNARVEQRANNPSCVSVWVCFKHDYKLPEHDEHRLRRRALLREYSDKHSDRHAQSRFLGWRHRVLVWSCGVAFGQRPHKYVHHHTDCGRKLHGAGRQYCWLYASLCLLSASLCLFSVCVSLCLTAVCVCSLGGDASKPLRWPEDEHHTRAVRARHTPQHGHECVGGVPRWF